MLLLSLCSDPDGPDDSSDAAPARPWRAGAEPGLAWAAGDVRRHEEGVATVLSQIHGRIRVRARWGKEEEEEEKEDMVAKTAAASITTTSTSATSTSAATTTTAAAAAATTTTTTRTTEIPTASLEATTKIQRRQGKLTLIPYWRKHSLRNEERTEQVLLSRYGPFSIDGWWERWPSLLAAF